MEAVIRTLDELVHKKIIKDYVIGGATALMYFSPPTLTEDIDVFVYLENQSGSLIDLGPLYTYLVEKKAATAHGQYLIVDGFPVQFLVPYDELSKEAFNNAVHATIKNLRFKVFDLEYLMAIMIQLAKDKYRERLHLLYRKGLYDEAKLDVLLERFGLKDRWSRMRALFDKDFS